METGNPHTKLHEDASSDTEKSVPEGSISQNRRNHTNWLNGTEESFQVFAHKSKLENCQYLWYLVADNNCIYCGAVDSAEHTLFEFGWWYERKRIGQTNIGTMITTDTMMPLMMETVSKWEAVHQMLITIIRNKEREELADQKRAVTVWIWPRN